MTRDDQTEGIQGATLDAERFNRVAGMLRGKHMPETVAASCGVTLAQVQAVARKIGVKLKNDKRR